EHLVKWKAIFLEFFNGHGWRITEEVPHDPIGSHTARDIEDLGGHLNARRWHGKVAALIAFHLADAIKYGQGLTPCRVIVEEIGNLGALLRTPFVLEILHRCTHLRPVGSGHREDIGIALTIRGIGPPEAWGEPWEFVLHMPWRQGIDNRCTVIQQRYSPLAFQTFVCFHAAVDLVAMLHFNKAQRVAFHSPLFVHQLDIIKDPRAYLYAHGFRRPGAVALPTHEDLIRDRRHHTPYTYDTRQDKATNQPPTELHRVLLRLEIPGQCWPIVSRHRATVGNSA